MAYVDEQIIDEHNTLWDVDDECEHEIKSTNGGGVKCTKCGGWFCY